MDDHSEIWRQYYRKALSKPHLKRTEFAIKLNESGLNVAIDCGCGTGSDIVLFYRTASVKCMVSTLIRIRLLYVAIVWSQIFGRDI